MIDKESDLLIAAKTWDNPQESVDEANSRIHDAADNLVSRANIFAKAVCNLFPINVPAGAKILEIGSGTGFIMEGVNRYLLERQKAPGIIDGLDIAEHMLAKAQKRLGNEKPYGFIHYDGVNIPRSDATYDLIYSVAALQHVPKPYVYNLFFEMKRLLKPGRYAVINLLSWDQFAHQETLIPWRQEISSQITRREQHWHHFYSKDELEAVLLTGTKFGFVEVRNKDGIWFCAGERRPTVPEGFNPFSYRKLNPDIQDMDPAWHWLNYGHAEDRKW